DNPVATGVTLHLVRLKYVKKTTAQGDEYYETQRIPVQTVSASTDAHGLAVARLPATSEGDYELDAFAKDARGHTIESRDWTWIAGGAQTGESYRTGGLQIIFDRKLYHIGDTAKVLIVSPVPDIPLLVTVEGDSLSSARVFRLHGTSTYFQVPVTKDFQPNAFVAACLVDGKQFTTAERSLNVLPEDKFLQVTLQSNKPRYQPGDTAIYTITTRDYRGRPVSADVSLGIVDEAIYAIAPDLTPDIRSFFHGPAWDSVSTSYSFPEEYSGGLDKFAADPRVRSNLQDTAAWFPELHTGADGRVQVTVKLPDNLTTWVATARAATLDTRVGAASLDVLATKDLLVRLEVPRFLVEGDRVYLSAIVHNYTQVAQPVRVRLEADGLQLENAAPQIVTIQPGDAQRVGWWATATQLGTVPITAIAQGTTAADAMRLPVPVEPFGLERFVPLAGTASATSPYAAPFTVPDGAIPARTSLTLKLDRTPLPAVLGAVDYLQQYPYWCVEQTMSRILPEVAIAPRLAHVGAPTGDRFNDAAAQVSTGLERLVGLQHGDGGWGWWAFDDSTPEMTSYVLEGLAEARRAGYTIPGDLPKRGVAYLQRIVPTIKRDLYTRTTAHSGGGPDARAFALLALEDWNAASQAEVDRLYSDRAGLSNYGLAQFTWLLEKRHDPRAAGMLATLRAHADVSASQIDWPADAPEFAWQDDSVGATAYGLEALLAANPSDPWVPSVVRWLTSKNAKGYWQSTKDSAIAAIALCDELVANPPAGSSATVAVALNGAPVASAAIDPADPWRAAQPITLGMGPLKTGDNTVTVTATGDGGVPVSGGMTTFERLDHIPAAPAPGLSVSRDYFVLPASLLAKAQGEGSFAQFYDEKLVSGLSRVGDRIATGARILVRLTFTNNRPMRYMALEDPMPAGCEVLDDQPTNWDYWWSGQEFHDDRAVFFFGALDKGTHHCYYVMRPTTTGEYRVLPSRIWAMYRPEVSAHAEDGRLTITE
ncbi:MAG TPA: alpha-2-macroglobulin family protein, partial [Oscillatoriaceae cyanobacterium]